MEFFEITKKSKKSRARLGVLHTAHGDIETPSFVPVATKGTLKALPPKDIKDIGVQVAFVNAYHLAMHPGVNIIEKFGGVHKYANLQIPLMSDSAGFQVFSLGKPNIKTKNGEEALLLKISEEGVLFRSPRDGKEVFFTPEISIQNQKKIGADIIMAFDECVYSGATKEYTREAVLRTHRWLARCMKTKRGVNQKLYGIVQGGVFKDLREESAKFVAKQKIDGIAIGGVSVGETKQEMRNEVRWALPHLPEHLPRHLLGIGRIEDIANFIPLGIDTFDCVELTRFARSGIVFSKQATRIFKIDLMKSAHLKNKNPIEKNCACYACKNFSLSFLHHLFKERELLGYYLATYHNLFFFERFFANIRENIRQGKL